MTDLKDDHDQAENDFRSSLPGRLRKALTVVDMDHAALELLRFLNEQVLREQELFWLRFYAFATLHAGAFVLATSSSVTRPKVVALFGALLAVVWVLVQWLSLRYADRAKPDYNALRQALGILWPHEEGYILNTGADSQSRLSTRVLRERRASSTDLGFWVAAIVLACWIAALFLLKNNA